MLASTPAHIPGFSFYPSRQKPFFPPYISTVQTQAGRVCAQVDLLVGDSAVDVILWNKGNGLDPVREKRKSHPKVKQCPASKNKTNKKEKGTACLRKCAPAKYSEHFTVQLNLTRLCVQCNGKLLPIPKCMSTLISAYMFIPHI